MAVQARDALQHLVFDAAFYDSYGGYLVLQVPQVSIPITYAGCTHVQNMKNNPSCILYLLEISVRIQMKLSYQGF
jgi:hypothetical protein